MRQRTRWAGALVVAGLLLAAGCQRAGRYTPPPADSSKPAPLAEAPKPRPVSELAWALPDPSLMEPEAPLVFVPATGETAAQWKELKHFWNDVTVPAAFIGLPPLSGAMAAVAGPRRLVRIKVPLGLADPAEFIPPSNPPTLGKWELGKKLFFDPNYLVAHDPDNPHKKEACADCHHPAKGFASGFLAVNAPTPINSVYNKHQFGDGRATFLEEVVQRALDGERPAAGAAPRTGHAWHGVVQRLRDDRDYDRRFKKVFGASPTQDALGKALATYLRTILSGDALQDHAEQAMREQGDKALEAKHYEKVLNERAIAALNDYQEAKTIGAPTYSVEKKAELARELHLGYTLFRGKGRCAVCHGGFTYSDGGFHNIGVNAPPPVPERGREPGRFAAVPLGLKDPRLIGAYKTPTLRALPRTWPYFHDTTGDTLYSVVQFHVHGGRDNPFLDRALRDDNGKLPDLKEEEARALTLFLLALDGEPIDAMVADPEKWPAASKP